MTCGGAKGFWCCWSADLAVDRGELDPEWAGCVELLVEVRMACSSHWDDSLIG